MVSWYRARISLNSSGMHISCMTLASSIAGSSASPYSLSAATRPPLPAQSADRTNSSAFEWPLLPSCEQTDVEATRI